MQIMVDIHRPELKRKKQQKKLIYAGIAHYRTTGETTLLTAAQRYADLCTDTFDPHRPDGESGHHGLEMALVELYRTTGQQAYLDIV